MGHKVQRTRNARIASGKYTGCFIVAAFAPAVAIKLRSKATPRFQAAHYLKPHVLVQDAQRRRAKIIPSRIDRVLHHHRHPDVRGFADCFAEKSWRRHAHNLERGFVNLHASPEHIGTQAKTLFPESVTHDGYWRAASHAIYFGIEGAPSNRLHAESRKMVSTH